MQGAERRPLSRWAFLSVIAIAVLAAACGTSALPSPEATSPGSDRTPPVPTQAIAGQPSATATATATAAPPSATATASAATRVVIFVPGLDTHAACSDTASGAGAEMARFDAVLDATRASSPGSVVTGLMFSYSGTWEDCGSGQRYDVASYAATMTPRGAASPPPAISPAYARTDTCLGVAAASRTLAGLADRVLARRPEARLTLVGHSLGGLIVDYYAVSAPSSVRFRLDAVLSVDSPLLGIDFTSTGCDPRILGSACELSGPSWKDVAGASDVVARIGSLGSSDLASRVFAVNATAIGQAIPGTREWRAGCAPFGGIFGLGHSCLFADPQSLAKIAAVIVGGPLEGFRMVT